MERQTVRTNAEIDGALLGLLQTGTSYRRQSLAEMLREDEGAVTRSLGRLQMRGQAQLLERGWWKGVNGTESLLPVPPAPDPALPPPPLEAVAEVETTPASFRAALERMRTDAAAAHARAQAACEHWQGVMDAITRILEEETLWPRPS